MAYVSKTPIVELSKNFRDYLIPLDHPRLHPNDRDARTHSKGVLSDSSIFLNPVAHGWLKLYKAPYKGFTTDGSVRDGLWKRDKSANAPTAAMVRAAEGVLKAATDEERRRFSYPVDAREWRSWSNPEVIIVDSGIRLEEMSSSLKAAVHELLAASLSSRGYDKVVKAMKVNAFLGEVTTLKNVMNEDSYHFCMFGTPAVDKPWGFNLFGHHLCLNVFSLAGELVVGPFFVGAEPNEIDDGPNQGMTVLNREEAAGLALMQSLSSEQQRKATIQGDINDIDGSSMQSGRWNPADLRGLGGAFQDNRIVPFEGICANEFDASQRKALLDIIATYNELLPNGAFEIMMTRVEAYLDETYFAWLGLVNEETPFYFRIHSPLVMNEFDHHNGVWLANALPKKYHIHTIQRLPNRGDYGRALYDEWLREQGR
ncbi:MAG: hypothetical protein M1821_002164 [Bathelium mastoideum]|nr:MAG: hypothetical protein M1821_002164 [Bathelium mastoideum]